MQVLKQLETAVDEDTGKILSTHGIQRASNILDVFVGPFQPFIVTQCYTRHYI